MALNPTIAPRPEAGSFRILHHDESGSVSSEGFHESWNFRHFGWDSLWDHPLWTYSHATWRWKDTFTNFDGEVTEYVHDESSNLKDLDPSQVQLANLYEGTQTTTSEYLGTSRHVYEVLDFTFHFTHSQSGRIIRSELGTIMRSADGIVMRDN